MAIDGEPKNGDFVRYIERLDRRAANSPGQVLPRPRRETRPETQPRASAQTGGSINNNEEQSTTRAKRGGQRHLAFALGIASAIALWNAVQRLFTAIEADALDIDNLIPIVFLLVCAWILFIGARGARRKQNKPLAKLPPLTTVQMGRKPKD